MTTRTWCGGLLLSLAVLPAAVFAQAPEGPREIKKYTNKTVFHLPVKIDDAMRGQLREVCLYVKAGNSDWVRQEAAPPSQSFFTYKVPQDGEYWFSLVTVDNLGKSTPADLRSLQPALKVVVDTREPVIEVKPWIGADGAPYLRCVLKDVNPDPHSLKLICKDEMGERVVEPTANDPSLFRLPGADTLQHVTRIVACDLCGNIGQYEFSAQETKTLAAVFQSGAVSTSARIEPKAPLPQDPGLALTSPKTEPEPALSAPKGGPGAPTAPQFPPTSPMALPPAAPIAPAPIAPAPLPSVPLPASAPLPPPALAANPPAPAAPQAGAVLPQAISPSTVAATKPSLASVNNLPGNRQVISTAKASLEYRVDQVGPSGISKVDIWMTSDQGGTWQRLCEDADHRSPAEIQLPGEGLFGLRLAVTNGNGFGGTAPAKGEQPTCWIEVDSTCPFVQLKPIDPITSNGALDIRWIATDKNLGTDPVSLFFRTRSDGPWQLMARGLKNDGQYRWTFPRDLGNQFFIRVEVADQAGNVGRVETPQPLVLDMTEPRASVISVTGMSKQ